MSQAWPSNGFDKSLSQERKALPQSGMISETASHGDRSRRPKDTGHLLEDKLVSSRQKLVKRFSPLAGALHISVRVPVEMCRAYTNATAKEQPEN